MAWIRCCGGSTKKVINKSIGLLAATTPTPTTQTPVNRTFVKGSYTTGIANNNYYSPTTVTNVTVVADNKIQFYNSGSYHYGLNYILPNDVHGGDTFHYDVTLSGNGYLSVIFYDNTGALIGNSSLGQITTGDVTVPLNAEYILFSYLSGATNQTLALEVNDMYIL